MKEKSVTDVGWLKDHLLDSNLRIIDCRWVLGEAGQGRRQYEAGHIPGAVHLDVEEHLSGREGSGRHPLPSKRQFQEVLSMIGISRETHLVAYDAGHGAPAPRLWWLLRYYGHENVSVLNGGWEAWIKAGGVVSTEVIHFESIDVTLRPKRKWVLDKSAVDALRDQPEVVLIDARAPERYRGEKEPIDPKAGHIPGAVNLPYGETIDPATGLFRTPKELKKAFEALGVDDTKKVISYCGSGITACTNLFALHLAGFDEGTLYEGSWSDWSSDSKLPVASS